MRTAVEELLLWMQENRYFIGNDLLEAVKECKDIEKDQIMEAYDSGCYKGRDAIVKSNLPLYTKLTIKFPEYTAEQYYDESFNTNK